jgi:hypothetical protein
MFVISSLCGVLVSSQERWTTIEGRVAIPNFGSQKGGLLPAPHRALSNIEIVLNGGDYSTLTTVYGDFLFLRVPPGVYSLDVNSVDYTFSTMKIKVSEEGQSENLNITVIEYKYPGAKKLPASYPISLIALAKNFYIPMKEPFSLYKIVAGNPMALMMLFSVVAVFALPAMMKNMVRIYLYFPPAQPCFFTFLFRLSCIQNSYQDPEELKRMQERRADSGEDPVKQLQVCANDIVENLVESSMFNSGLPLYIHLFASSSRA